MTNMKMLAFDTSSLACSIALNYPDKQANKLISSHIIAPMQQTALILPMIHELLTTANLTLHDLDAIAYGCGPGSFTGIRIATSVAQGIGFAINRPLIPISSLAALAQAAFFEKQWRKLCVALDARMGQIYFARYEVNADGLVELAGDEVVLAETAIDLSSIKEAYGVGDGWKKLKEPQISSVNAIDFTQIPTAEAVLKLAQPRFEQGDWIEAREAMPIYLR